MGEESKIEVIDLTMPIASGMPVFPGDPPVKIDRIHTYQENGWELRSLQFGSHTGTHVDAFSHMHQGAENLDQIPLEQFFGPAYLVGKGEALPRNSGLIFQEAVDEAQLQAILSVQPKFVGGNISESLERALLKHRILTYTNLVHLEKLPKGKPFMFYGFPLKIKAGDGSPVRAIAIIE